MSGLDLASSGLGGGKSGYLHQDLRERAFFLSSMGRGGGGGGGVGERALRRRRPLRLLLLLLPSSIELVEVDEEPFAEVCTNTSSSETGMAVSGALNEATVAKH